jgi:3-oxoacyl-[acyl-carrier-protein] synthase II
VGNNVPKFWDALLRGESGIKPITHFDASEWPVTIAGYIHDFDPSGIIDGKLQKNTSRYQQFALAATAQAMAQAGFKVVGEDQKGNIYGSDLSTLMVIDGDRMGVIYGSGVGGFEAHDNQCEVLRAKGIGRVSPHLVTMMIPDTAAGLISIEYRAKGINYAPVAACASSTFAVGEAFRNIRDGYADIIITGGSEAAITPLGFGSFVAPRALSKRNDNPTGASRPFDIDRDGFVMSEGAATLVLENWDFAKARGANILAEVVGYGFSADAHHLTAPDPTGDGARRSMALALQVAGLEADHIGYISAHGTATVGGDVPETLAIRDLFGERKYAPPISSVKSTIGHTLGASGAIELVACIEAMRTGLIPPTINLDNIDPACGDLDFVPNEAKKANTKINFVIKNSFGFGGHNASIVLARV